MKLTKLDLSSIVAIGHSDDKLGLLIDRGDSVEYIEVVAPVAAYYGLQQVNYIANTDFSELPEVDEDLIKLPVRSTMAKTIGYNEHQKLLQVEFKNGSVYQYEDVDEETWEELQEADSIGEFYNQEIRGSYRSRRLA